MINNTAIRTIEKEADALKAMATQMWNNPELAYNEVNACKWTAEFLRHYGFEVETGYAGLPTCVVGKWGSGHPVVGFLGELDALPGLSQKIQTTKEPLNPAPNAPGHGCGHNLLNTSCLAAAIGTKAEMEERNIPGTVIFYGCPAEEVLTGKVFMARNGAFDGLDFAYAWHGLNTNNIGTGINTGLNSAVFHFKGRTAHAGGDPHNGRSALDAAELMSVGANYLREHVTSDVRFHYSYKEAGTAPNIVPDKASVWYFIRAFSREAIDDTYNRLTKVAKGAAMMTETEVEIEFLGGCYPTMPNQFMAEKAHRIMKEIGVPQYTEEELKFAEELNERSPQYDKFKASGMLDNGPIHTGVQDLIPVNVYGSTDVGDVQHICPCVSVKTACWNLAAPGHSWQITACAGTSIGHKGMLFGGKVMATAAIEMMTHPEYIEKAKEEFRQQMNGRPYKCPIPADIPVPQPEAK